MDSLSLFEHKRLAPKEPSRPLWLVALLATILPGGGHLLLRRTRLGLLLLGGIFALLVPMTAAAILDWSHLQWLTLRAMTVIYLFSVVDAVFLCYELPDGRANSGCSPRQAALGNLLLYGLGYYLTGQKGLAVVAALGGLLLHGVLGAGHLVFLIVGEVAVLVLAYHVHQATTYAAPREGRQRDSTPGWLTPVAGIFVLGHLALLVLTLHVGEQMKRALEVDQSRALAVEPYYQNSTYGVSVELNAPGWTFLDASKDEFVHARHVSGAAELSLRTAPRLFGFPDAATMARTVFGEGILEGLSLSIVDEGPYRLAELPGWRVRAVGHLGHDARQVEIIVVGKGWRYYVVWYEWSQKQGDFAAQELDYLLRNVDLAGMRPPREANVAR